MAFIPTPALLAARRRSPLRRPRVCAMAPGGGGGLPRTAWVAAPATAATAARVAVRSSPADVKDARLAAAAAAAPVPVLDTVDEAALRAADILEALTDLADLRRRVVAGEGRLGSPTTEAGAARRLRAMDAMKASLEAELTSLEFDR
eukprot:TRINITY_DN3665_c0_g1_i4.p4 TRINITY_DN3665_c0_g1~~TRINITY_DN3665_c0_g1_i4.p4  ORF type:complete len:147 (+),score=48.05 TRINITY_DN3665_c0_g1_i4:333-773(+)